MLVLTGVTAYYLVPGVDYIIGRKKDSDIFLHAEIKHGVSRHHGKLCYHSNGEVLYTDLSQFGTVVNDRKLQNKESIALQPGSELKFGQYPVIWRLDKMMVAASNLLGSTSSQAPSTTRTRTSTVKEECRRLGVPFGDVWDTACTTLIMDSISTTAKVIGAVSQCRSIVTPKFLSDLVAASLAKTKMRSIKEYLPPTNDTALRTVSFLPAYQRKTLFEHLNFIFVTECEMKENEDVIRATGGSPTFLDPLHPHRREVLLSSSSIVMATKDAALNTYIRKTLSERGLAPTKSADLALAVFHIDKSKLFKRITDTQSSQLVIQNTQVMSQVIDLTQSLHDPVHVEPVSRSAGNARPVDISVFEPSVVPPRLDKTIKTPDLASQKQFKHPLSRVAASSGSSSASRSTVESPKSVRSANSETTPVQSPRSNNNVSVFEPSVIPPRLDKTIKTPNISLLESPKSSNNVSVFEPSVVPPRLDKTIKTPNTSISDPLTSTTIFEASEIPPRLDKTVKTPNSSIVDSPRNTKPNTNSVKQSGTFKATPPQIKRENKENERQRRAESISRPTTTQSHKRGMLSDSDDDEEANPFGPTKSSTLFGNTISSFHKAVDHIPDAKRFKTASGSPESTASRGTASPVIAPVSVVKSEISPFNENNEGPGSKPTDHILPCSAPTQPLSDTSSPQCSKRELIEKYESVPKKTKLEVSSTTQKTVIPDITSQSSIWMTNSHHNSNQSNSIDKPFGDLVITEMSLVVMNSSWKSDVSRLHEDALGSGDGQINYKRFKKKGPVVRSMVLSLSESDFRSNEVSALLQSQFSQSQITESQDEDEVSNLFFNRLK